MVTIETVPSTLKKGKVHCETCPKILSDLPLPDEPIGQEIINVLTAVAENHQRHHPKHVLAVYIYYPQPEAVS